MTNTPRMIGETRVLSRTDIGDGLRDIYGYAKEDTLRSFISGILNTIQTYCANNGVENGILIPMEYEGMQLMVGTLPVMLPNKHGGLSEKSNRYAVISRASYEEAIVPKVQQLFGEGTLKVESETPPSQSLPVKEAKKQGYEALSKYFQGNERAVVEAVIQRGLKVTDGTGLVCLGGGNTFPIQAAKVSLHVNGGGSKGKSITFYMIHPDSVAHARAWLDAEIKKDPKFAIMQANAVKMARGK